MKCLSEDEEFFIPVKYIEKYHYCPRIIYFEGVLGENEEITESMKFGKEEHEKEKKLEDRRTTLLAKRKLKVLEKWHNLYFISKKLGIKGIIDTIVKTEYGYRLIEIKYTKGSRKPPVGYIYQAIAYAMLAEENMNIIIPKIILYFTKDDKIFEINVDENLRRHVIWTIEKIKKIIKEERLPRFKESRKCNGCGYLRLCRKV